MNSLTIAPTNGFESGLRIADREFAMVRMRESPGLNSNGEENQAPSTRFLKRLAVGSRERDSMLGCA